MRRPSTTVFLFALLSSAGLALAQAPPAKAGWTVSRTSDGQPDLQGIWTNATITPLERPRALEGKVTLTNEEAAAIEKQTADQRVATDKFGPLDAGSYNRFWYDDGTKVLSTRQTSLVVDPTDGRVPVRPSAEARRDGYAARNSDSYEFMSIWDRCISRGVPGGMFPAGYNNAYQIIQTPEYVVISYEMIHEARIIPIDKRPPLPAHRQFWMGDSRGHWEGDTLVIDTRNFNNLGWISTSAASGRIKGIPNTDKLHVVERLKRTSKNEISYSATIEDPDIYTRPWTVAFPLSADPDYRIYEYACHEGNYAVENILRGARAEDKRPEAAANSCVSFKEAVNIDTGLFASGVVIEDFNADGAADLAVTNQNANNVSVLLGDGTGAFRAKTDFPAGGAPQRIASADLDGDRNIDLVLPITAGNAVAILFGDGQGRFSQPALFPVTGGPFMTVVADFNGDTRLDVAVTTQTAGSRRVAVLLGNGSRAFSAPASFGTFESTPTALGAADFNRDGKLDLAAGGGSNVPPGSNNLSIMLGDGQGGFGAPAYFTVGTAPQSMSIADYNGDGLSDIAISNSMPAGTNSTVSVLFGDGKGGFTERLPLDIGVLGRGTGVADFNGDGKLDLVVANSTSNTVSVLIGDGKGHFAARQDFPVGQNPRKLAVGDLNRDGRPDIVTPNTGSNNISILINSCPR